MQALSPLQVSVYFPTKYVRKVMIKPLMLVSSLRISVIPKDLNCALIFNGSILDESKTFEYYQLQDGDIIVISPSQTANLKWIKLTEQQNYVKDMIKFMVNPQITKEICRLKDIRFNKLELIKPSRLHKIGKRCQFVTIYNDCSEYNNNESISNGSISSQTEKIFPTVIPDTVSEKPFDKALTFIWNE